MKSLITYMLFGLWIDLFMRWRVNTRYHSVLRVLSLHRVIDEGHDLSDRDIEDLERGCLTLNQFIERLEYMRKYYRFISLDEAVDIIRANGYFSGREVVLTFDDAYRDLYQNAFRELSKRDIPFTVFLTKNYINRNPLMLSSDEIDAMAGCPLATWGAHGVSHRKLGELSESEMRNEISESRVYVENMLKGNGVDPDVKYFCYPDGDFSDDIISVLKQNGFEGACATARTVNGFDVDPYAIKRIPCESESLARFAFRLAGKT